MNNTINNSMEILKSISFIVDAFAKYKSFAIECIVVVSEELDSDDEFDISFFEKRRENYTPEQQDNLNYLKKCCDEGWCSVEVVSKTEFEARNISKISDACWNWLAGEQGLLLQSQGNIASDTRTRCIHFYGYMGGQGRSATLAQFAKYLALEMNHRVLILDLDIEAPSQHLIFDRNVDGNRSTVFEFETHDNRFLKNGDNPLEVVFTEYERSGVYLLGAQTGSNLISKRISFLQSLSTTPGLFKLLLERIEKYTKMAQFDSILIDHSTGLNQLILPAIQVFGGEGIVFCKLDAQWREAKHGLSILAQQFNRTAVVSFDSHGQNSAQREERDDYSRQISDLEAIVFGENEIEREEKSVFELENFHFFWDYDVAFKESLFPKFDAETSKGKKMISSLVQYLEMPKIEGKLKVAHARGSTDKRALIETPSIEELYSKSDDNLFVIGRKGVGKTKIAKHLSLERKGFALLIDDDSNTTGLPCHSPLLRDDVLKYSDSPDQFWWKLFLAGIRAHSDLKDEIERQYKALKPTECSFFDQFEYELKNGKGQRRFFIIDGLELLIDVSMRQKFVNSLFHVLRNFDGLRAVGYPIFLREDVLELGENWEQISDKRRIDLTWYEGDALEFLLRRIAPLKQTSNFIGLQSKAN